jgi:hypothetical protein
MRETRRGALAAAAEGMRSASLPGNLIRMVDRSLSPAGDRPEFGARLAGRKAWDGALFFG